MRKEAVRRDARLHVPVLLAEAGFVEVARATARRLVEESPRDLDRVGLASQLAHRAGAVSEALEGFRVLHQTSPHSHAALLRLATMHREEELPRRPPADVPLVRRVLRVFGTGDTRRALAMCGEGARAARAAGDHEQQKLLGLLEALLHEIGGDLRSAAFALESLGRDKAFALDLDRLALLARVCERSGDRGGLTSAERVLAYLTQSGKLSAFPRLMAVRHALGDAAGEARARAGYEEAFRRRIHALTAEERLEAARSCFVPPERLGEVSGARDALADGIVRLASGDARGALPQLEGDRAGWRAAALLAAGRAADAADAAGEALRGAEVGLPVAMLVARVAAGGGRLRREILELAAGELRAQLRADAVEADVARALAVCEECLGHPARAAALRARAAAAEAMPWPPCGVVRAAAVYLLPGKPKGLVHDVIARRRAAAAGEAGQLVDQDVLGALGEEPREAIRRTFAAVKEVLASRMPERAGSFGEFAYGLHVTKEDEPSWGVSLGLPVALAFASVLLQRPVPRTVAVTGAISYDAVGRIAIRPVGEIGVKLKGALGAGVARLVIPAAQVEEALSGAAVPVSIARRAIVPVSSFPEALAATLGDVP